MKGRQQAAQLGGEVSPHVTWPALTGSARALGTPRHFEDESNAQLSAEFDSDLQRGASVTTLGNGALQILGGRVGWLVSDCGRAVIDAKARAALEQQVGDAP